MHKSLYRIYRPRSFSDVIGQDAAVHVIQTAIHRDKVAHAYLFSGPRGSGKTSLARLLARALNCTDLSREGEPCGKCSHCTAISRGDHLDVIEIDGASNNGVDEVRELRAKVSLTPFSGSHKVYIIDEVHMLSTAAFNALLKTIEEPPEHVVFILATTEPHKVPVTIRSRCQHIPFHRIAVTDIRQRLRQVCEQEGFEIQEEALWELARQADGALRDALSLLEQAVTLSSGDLTMEGVQRMLGGGTRPEVERWLRLLREGVAEAHLQLKAMIDSGVSPERFLDQVFLLFRDLWVFRKWGKGATAGLDLSEQEKAFLAEEAPHWSERDLSLAMDHCLRLFGRVRLGIRGDVFVGALTTGLLGEPVERVAETETRHPSPKPPVSRGKAPTETPGVPGRDFSRREPAPSPVVEERPRRVSVSPPTKDEKKPFKVPRPRNDSAVNDLAPSGPEGAGEGAGRDAERPTRFGQDPARAWSSLVAELGATDFALFAALARCEVRFESDASLTVLPPTDSPFLGDLIAQERHSWHLIRLCRARGIEKSIRLVLGEEAVLLHVPPETDPEESLPGSSGTLFQVPVSVSGSRERSEHEPSPGGPETLDRATQQAGVEKDVDRLRRWFSADLLLMKKDSGREEDDPSEETVEEGAAEI